MILVDRDPGTAAAHLTRAQITPATARGILALNIVVRHIIENVKVDSLSSSVGHGFRNSGLIQDLCMCNRHENPGHRILPTVFEGCPQFKR